MTLLERLFGRRRAQEESLRVKATAEQIAEMERATRALEERVQRLEADSRVFIIRRRRQLSTRHHERGAQW